MSFTKAHQIDDPYALIKKLAGRVKVLETSPNDFAIPLPLQPFGGAGVDFAPGNGTYATVTSATFAATHLARYMFTAYDAIVAMIGVQADVGTTGEIKLFENGLNTSSDVFSITSGFNNNLVWTWLHGYPAGVQDPRIAANTLFQPQVQARRTGGAGAIRVFYPTEFVMIRGGLCAASTGGQPGIRDH